MCEKEMVLEAGMTAISEEAIDKIDTLSSGIGKCINGERDGLRRKQC